MSEEKKRKPSNTIRLRDEQAVAYDDIKRALEQAEYEATGSYRHKRQWEVVQHLFDLPQVQDLRRRGTRSIDRL